MNLIVVADSLEYSQPLMQAAGESGYRIEQFIMPNDDLVALLKTTSAHAVVFDIASISHEELRRMRSIAQMRPMPVLVLTQDSVTESIEAAINAGASSYVIDCEDLTTRLASLLQVAAARFKQQLLLINELDTMRTALVQRKIIEKAKGIIMKQRNLDEDNAYKAIRKLAMNHNKKIGEVAGQIVTAAEILL